MIQNEASQVDRKASSLMYCSAKLLYNPSNLAFWIQSLSFADSSANVWQLSGTNPGELGGEGEFVHGAFVADHIKAKSRGGRLPDWKDCAVDMIAKGSSLGFVFLI
jgi:hypothetical protein